MLSHPLNENGEACFRIPEDLHVLNCFNFPIWITDLDPQDFKTVWASKEGLRCWNKQSMEQFRAIDTSKRSESVKKLNNEWHQLVQVEQKCIGPFRRTIFPENVPCTVDMHVVPIRGQCEGDSAPKVYPLIYCSYVSLDEGSTKALISHEMLTRLSMHAMLFHKEGDGKLVHANPEARHHYRELDRLKEDDNFKLRDVLESFMWESAEDIDDTLNKIQDLDTGCGAVVFERAVSAPSSEASDRRWNEVWFKMKFIATYEPAAGKPAILITGADVSEARRAQSDLLLVNSRQEQFFAEVAHELRTPLHCITGLAETMLKEPTIKPARAKSLSIIRSEGMRLSALVSDILDAASAMRKTLLISHQSVSIASVASAVVETMQTLAKRGVSLISEVPDALPLIEADSRRIFQILVNLVSNSLRFTAKGSVSLSARTVHDAQNGGAVEVSVTDTGIGIPEEKLDDIFGAFKRVDAQTTRKFGGTGLGLALVKTLVEAHHGTVTVRSRCGVSDSGTVFVITLPIHQTKSDADREVLDSPALATTGSARSRRMSTSDIATDIEKSIGALQERLQKLEEERVEIKQRLDSLQTQHPRDHTSPDHVTSTPDSPDPVDRRDGSRYNPSTVPSLHGGESNGREDEARRKVGARGGKGGARALERTVLLRMMQHEALAREAAERRERLAFEMQQRNTATMNRLMLHLAGPDALSTNQPTGE